MSYDNPGQFAFPSHGTMGEVVQPGMTLRDYFAAKAMAAAQSHWLLGLFCIFLSRKSLAEHAYAEADAMLRARCSAPSGAPEGRGG